MNLQELKNKQPEDLLKQADKLGIENPSSFRKQDLMFAILKQIASDGSSIKMKEKFVWIHSRVSCPLSVVPICVLPTRTLSPTLS